MKKLLIALPVFAVLVGCGHNPDAKFVDHAPGSDAALKLTSYPIQKPGIPSPKPTMAAPAVLRN